MIAGRDDAACFVFVVSVHAGRLLLVHVTGSSAVDPLLCINQTAKHFVLACVYGCVMLGDRKIIFKFVLDRTGPATGFIFRASHATSCHTSPLAFR